MKRAALLLLLLMACLATTARAQSGRELIEDSLRRHAPPAWVYEEQTLVLSDPQGHYYPWFRREEALADSLVRTSPTRPEDVARAVDRALAARRPRLRYVVGRRAALVLALRRHIPGEIFERLYWGEAMRRGRWRSRRRRRSLRRRRRARQAAWRRPGRPHRRRRRGPCRP